MGKTSETLIQNEEKTKKSRCRRVVSGTAGRKLYIIKLRRIEADQRQTKIVKNCANTLKLPRSRKQFRKSTNQEHSSQKPDKTDGNH